MKVARFFDSTNAMRWLRKTHGWIGLWGAALGLLFGFSGIWLNHRAVLKLPPVLQQRSQVQLALPEPAPVNTQEMMQWLQDAVGLKSEAGSVRVDAARPLAWIERSGTKPGAAPEASSAMKPMMQPERWVFNFGGPSMMVQAEYWQGNRSVSVSTTANGFIATLTNLHKGVGMSVPWILLIDTLAGSMIFLSISGVILWTQMNRRRVIGASIFSASIALILVLIGMRI